MTLTQVIIPIDFSDGSQAAVDCGRDLAARSRAGVELLAVTTPRYVNVTDAALESLARNTFDDVADDAAASAADGVAGRGPAPSWRVLVSDDDDVEATLVDAVLADTDALWCVASHGRTAVGELLFGSVSADLVRDAGVPIVVVGRHAAPRPGAGVLAVALDGSTASEQVLPAALWVAGSLGLRLRLLQVGVPHEPTDGIDTAYLAGVSRRLPHPETADYDTLYGDVSEALTSYIAGTPDVALLIMATRGATATARLSAPSVAMHVVRRSAVPVVLVHPPHLAADTPADARADTGARGGQAHVVDDLSVALPILADRRTRVVVGVDHYATAAPAVRWAAAEATRRGAMLEVVHTWQVPVSASSMYEAAVWPDMEVCRHAAFEEMAAAAEAIAREFPELLVETVVAEGRAADAIVAEADGAELVVLGHRHRGRLDRWLTGSTSSATALRLRCPLVIVPCDDDEDADS